MAELTKVIKKEGRLDCLLNSLAKMATLKLEHKLNLPGLSMGVMPILEDEIKKNVSSKTIIPKKYRNLTRLVGEQISRVG